MPKRDEPAILLSVDTRLPVDLKLTTWKFREGWESVHASDARVLGKRVKRCKWQLVVDAEPLLKGGLGKTPLAATASALKLALRLVGQSFNSARVQYLELNKYPWFYLATVAVYPHAIKQDYSAV
jgi:hypothetical protein